MIKQRKRVRREEMLPGEQRKPRKMRPVSSRLAMRRSHVMKEVEALTTMASMTSLDQSRKRRSAPRRSRRRRKRKRKAES